MKLQAYQYNIIKWHKGSKGLSILRNLGILEKYQVKIETDPRAHSLSHWSLSIAIKKYAKVHRIFVLAARMGASLSFYEV